MANARTGVDLDIVGSAASLNPAIKVFRPNDSEGISDEVPSAGVTATFTNNYPPAFPSRNVTGINATTYFEDFYFRIRYLPPRLSLGALTSDQTRDLFVFNGFFVDQTLDDISVPTGQGIQITGPATPTTYSPLTISQYQVSISSEGPTSIDTNITFDWADPVEDESIPITGSRVVGFPWTYTTPVEESLEWATSLLISNDGTEQRLRTRIAPRQSFSLNIGVPRDQVSATNILLYAWRANMWALPVWTEVRRSTSAVTTSDDTINVNTEYGDFRVGSLAIVWTTPTTFDVFEIDTITQTTLRATRNFNQDFPTDSYVAPCRIARMTQDPVRNTTGTQVRIQAQFEVQDNEAISSSPSQFQYQGLDVLVRQPNTSGAFSPDRYASRVDVVDNGSGVVDIFAPWTHNKVARDFLYIFEGLQDVWEFRQWLHRRSGRRVPFYMPTFENDLRMITTGDIISSFVIINDGQVPHAEDRNTIAIKTTTTWLFRQATFSAFGDDVSVTLDSPINIPASTIEFISFMGQKRLETDRITFQWLPNNVAQCVVSILEIAP